MTKIDVLFAKVTAQNIRIWAEDDDICYDAPVGGMTQELRSRLKENKEDILAFLRASKDTNHRHISGQISHVPRDGVLPISYYQEGIWLLNQLQGSTPEYVLPLAVRFEGPLDVDVLKQSINEIVRRQESIRCTFYAGKDGSPQFAISDSAAVPLPVREIERSSEQEQLREVKELAREESRQPFDLTKGPLFRTTLLRLNHRHHVLLVSIHHLVADGLSLILLLNELGTLYDAFAQGKPSPLPALTVQYPDFAAWHRRFLTREKIDDQLAYWEKAVEGAPFVLDLPTDRPRPDYMSTIGDSIPVCIGRDVTSRIKSACRESGVTLYMFLMSAFAVLLSRYSCQNDLIVGTTMSNRNRKEIEPLIGYFINILPIRFCLDSDVSFQDVLKQARQVIVEAYAHQDVPFEHLVQRLNPKRDVARHPVFQVMFGLRSAPSFPPLLSGGITMGLIEFNMGTARFDLELNLSEISGALQGAFEFNSLLFDASTVKRLAGHFSNLVENLCLSLDKNIHEVTFLSEEEHKNLLAWSGDLPTQCSDDRTIIEAFEAQAMRTPDRKAVSYQGDSVSYKDLNEHANGLARRLIELGAGPNTRVAILLERSPTLIVSILSVLKTGAAYVPLDPAHPEERHTFLLEDTEVSVLIVNSCLREDLLASYNGQLLELNDLEDIAPESGMNLPAATNPESPAYVIYTSGSTGRPKGVVVTNGNVMRLFSATKDWFSFDEQDVWTLFHSAAFDFSVWEMWGALLFGGRLVIVPYPISRSPDEFHELLRHEKVTVLNQTPSAFRSLIHLDQSMEASKDLSLRLVILGGEALRVGDLRPWIERYGDAIPQIVNMYGITETTVHVTYRSISISDLDRSGSSVIGRPIPDLRVYILDPQRRPVPIGVVGELFIAGAGVAKGYLNRPELTAERFIANPFDDGAFPRLYRTGDLARFMPDGDIEYIGRIDDQIQIRGFRIEIGEIEAILVEHPGIRETVVMTREDVPGNLCLVAYIVSGQSPPGMDELRTFLKQKLPDYMIPAAFVILDAFPLTFSGKVDRRALPAPTLERQTEKVYVAPQTELELTISTIWQEILQLEKIGIEDNFFDLGGHSLWMAQVHSKLTAKIKKDISMVVMFQYPTISSLAQHLSRENKVSSVYQFAEERTEKLEEGKQRLKKRIKHCPKKEG